MNSKPTARPHRHNPFFLRAPSALPHSLKTSRRGGAVDVRVTTTGAEGILTTVPLQRKTDRAIYDVYVLGSSAHRCTSWIQSIFGTARGAGGASFDRPGVRLFNVQPAAHQTDRTECLRARRLESEGG